MASKARAALRELQQAVLSNEADSIVIHSINYSDLDEADKENLEELIRQGKVVPQIRTPLHDRHSSLTSRNGPPAKKRRTGTSSKIEIPETPQPERKRDAYESSLSRSQEDDDTDSEYEDDGVVDEDEELEAAVAAEAEEDEEEADAWEGEASGSEEEQEEIVPLRRSKRTAGGCAVQSPKGTRQKRKQKRKNTTQKPSIGRKKWEVIDFLTVDIGAATNAPTPVPATTDEDAVAEFERIMKYAIRERCRQAKGTVGTMASAWKFKLRRLGEAGVWQVVDKFVPRAVRIAFGRGVPTKDILLSLPQATDAELNEFGVYLSLILSRPEEFAYEGRYIGSGTALDTSQNRRPPGLGARWKMYEDFAQMIGSLADEAKSKADAPRGQKTYYAAKHDCRHTKQALRSDRSWHLRLLATIPKDESPWKAQLIEGLMTDLARTLTDRCPPPGSETCRYQTPVAVSGSKAAVPSSHRHPEHDKLNGCSPFMQTMRESAEALEKTRRERLDPGGGCWCCKRDLMVEGADEQLRSIQPWPCLEEVAGGSYACNACYWAWINVAKAQGASESVAVEFLEEMPKRDRSVKTPAEKGAKNKAAIAALGSKCPVCKVVYEEDDRTLWRGFDDIPGFRTVYPDMAIVKVCQPCKNAWQLKMGMTIKRGKSYATKENTAAGFSEWAAERTEEYASLVAAQQAAIAGGDESARLGRTFKKRDDVKLPKGTHLAAYKGGKKRR